ncbi:GntR family transcriptional regulator [Aquabacterium sp.]|uniref:GntR family transcriptional regulator n=1 Tax=Aquabacterium sp. TaxID=1872578 RepID=UPI00344C5197
MPGTKLVEDKLGQAFGVSRTRIRQVLIRLAQEQVITLRPNKGASVAEPTVDEAREVFEARAVVESVLMQRFVARAKALDLKILSDCIDAEEVAGSELPMRGVQACRCEEHPGLLAALRSAPRSWPCTC